MHGMILWTIQTTTDPERMRRSTDWHDWLKCLERRPAPSIKLICFPYAGGTIATFRDWPAYLPADVELYAIQLPGRANRTREVVCDRLQPLVQQLAETIGPVLEPPFAFFGHSMGALVSFELARELRRRRLPGPARQYVSGHRAPQLPDPNPAIHHLPEAEFLEEVRQLAGTPPEVLENEELMRLLLPTLRADFAACETYTYVAQPPLDIEIVAFGSLEDSQVSRPELQAWREQTQASFMLWMFPGDHFYLHYDAESLLRIMSRDLIKAIQTVRAGVL
jgi:medium-chain acyl-[acyl-carrier-protein] hydrolase